MNQEPPRKPPPPQRPPFPSTRQPSVTTSQPPAASTGPQPKPVVASNKPQPTRPVPPQKPTTLNRASSQQASGGPTKHTPLPTQTSTTTRSAIPNDTTPTTKPVSTTNSTAATAATAAAKSTAEVFNNTSNKINTSLAKMNPAMEKCTNFMRQFRDAESRELKKLTANQFMEVWGHYDEDGNGFIEGSELDGFLREFVSSVNIQETGPEAVSDQMLSELRDCFMEAYDDNQDGRIEIRELAQLLPMEENFLLLFRFDNPLDSSVEFMKIWKAYDKDNSGFIEADELKSFLRDLLKEAKKDQDVGDEKLTEYTETMLQVFDQNKDGKLQLSEMAKLLPVKENFLCRSVFKGAAKVTREDIERVFSLYDRDNNGTIENEELNGFLKDLLELVKKDYDALDLQEFQDSIMRGCDFNKDGKINKKELTMILLALAKHGADVDDSELQAGNPLAEIATIGMKALKMQKLRVRHFMTRTLGNPNATPPPGTS